MSGYIRTILVTMVAALGAIGAVSGTVDPYGIHRFFTLEKVNARRGSIESHMRRTKAADIIRRRPQILLVGTSRIQRGMDPRRLKEAAQRETYNLGLSNLRMREALLFIDHALANTRPDLVIFGADLFSFNAAEQTFEGVDYEKLGGRSLLPYWTEAFFSASALRDSIATVKDNLTRQGPSDGAHRSDFRADGYYGEAIAPRPVPRHEDIEHRIGNYVRRWLSDFSVTPEVYADFERMLQRLRETGTRVVTFVSPAHALHWETVDALGLWDEFEAWKQNLARLSALHGAEIWDFSGYNSITTQPILESSRYYRDHSHYTEATGHLVLGRIVPEITQAVDVPSDFGRRLGDEPFAVHQRRIELERAEFRSRNSEQVAWVRRIAARDRVGKRLDWRAPGDGGRVADEAPAAGARAAQATVAGLDGAGASAGTSTIPAGR